MTKALTLKHTIVAAECKAAIARPIVRPPLIEAHADVALADIKDFAALSRMSESWIHDAVKNGLAPVPVIKQPRCTRWRLADIRAWLIKRASAAEQDQTVADRVTAQATMASAAARAKRRGQPAQQS